MESQFQMWEKLPVLVYSACTHTHTHTHAGKNTTTTHILTNSVEGFPFLHTLSSIFVCRFFDDDYSDLCEVTLHCSFDLHFSNE